MERIQIQVTEEQKTALQRKAAASGKSIAGVIRDAVDRYVAADDRESRIERVLTALRRGFRDREG
ncbi:MAG: ribbon-helix-helix protein, CopG family, partial [Chloroflexi bacterium]